MCSLGARPVPILGYAANMPPREQRHHAIFGVYDERHGAEGASMGKQDCTTEDTEDAEEWRGRAGISLARRSMVGMVEDGAAAELADGVGGLRRVAGLERAVEAGEFTQLPMAAPAMGKRRAKLAALETVLQADTTGKPARLSPRAFHGTNVRPLVSAGPRRSGRRWAGGSSHRHR